jgi:hypothetical protein
VIAADRLWIMIDVETSGPILGTHSMTELGAVVGSKARGVIDREPGPQVHGRAAARRGGRRGDPAEVFLRAGMKTRQIVLLADFSSCARE